VSQSSSSSAKAGAHGIGLRGTTDERRHQSRRHGARPGRERRRGDRRRAGLRTLLLTAATLSTPNAAKVLTSTIQDVRQKQPSVSYTIDSVTAPVYAKYAYDDIVAEAALLYDLDPHMIRAVMQTESGFNPMAVSPVGALGLMQLMPAVAAELGATDPLDPRQNIMAGSRYLRQLLDAHRGNIRLALASYNAGPANVAKYRAVPPFKETQNYVKKVTALLSEARAGQGD
jgi:soluble lytic murein transglycosylase-like protein